MTHHHSHPQLIRRALFLGCALIALQACPVYAGQDIATLDISTDDAANEHGKINTADASPVDPGHYEIEPSFAFTSASHYWDGSGSRHGRGTFRESDLALSVSAGLIEDVDINVSAGYSWIKDNDSTFDPDDDAMGPFRGDDFGDVSISGRYRFYKDDTRHIEIAYIGGVTIPTGTDSDRDKIGTSQEFWSIDQTLVISKDWGKWTGNAALGYSLPIGNKRGDDRGTWTGDVALGYQVLPWLQPEIELNYGHDIIEDEDDSQCLAITVGLVMPINETLRINVGVQQSLWGENADETTTLVTAIKFAF